MSAVFTLLWGCLATATCFPSVGGQLDACRLQELERDWRGQVASGLAGYSEGKEHPLSE